VGRLQHCMRLHIIPMNRYRNIIFAAWFILAAGCVSTNLKSGEIPFKVKNLAAENSKPLALQVTRQKDFSSLGHQYFLLVIPMGSIYFPSIENAVSAGAFVKLSLAGYRPLLNNAGTGLPKVLLSIQNAQLSAYDFLFLRKIVCRLEISGLLLDSENNVKRSQRANVSRSEYKALAFEPELQHTFELCLQSGIEEVLETLGLVK